MSAKRSKRKMGRPPLRPEDRKLPSMGFRPTRELRGQLEDAAAISGKSKTQEIEFRLERSFSDADVRHAEFGGKAIYEFMKKLARIAQIVELRTEASFGDDAYTQAETISAMQSVLSAYQISAAGMAAEHGRGTFSGEPPIGTLGKEVAEGPGSEIGRELARFILGIDVDPGTRASKKQA